MTRNHIAIFTLLGALFSLESIAQTNFQLGLLPSININKKLPQDWSINFKTESRQSLYRNTWDYEYLLTDVSLAAAKKVGINTTIAIGYLMRITNEGIRNRAIQQIAIVKRFPGFSLGNRFSADQTFQLEDQTAFRLRYRASLEVPLNGQSLDPKEFFIKINNEYLNGFFRKVYDLEIRGAGFIGYSLSPKNKLEFGLDYRINGFVQSASRHRLWIGMNFYQSI